MGFSFLPFSRESGWKSECQCGHSLRGLTVIDQKKKKTVKKMQ